MITRIVPALWSLGVCILGAAAYLWIPGAHAQVATFDGTNLVQNIQQVQQAVKSINEMKKQLETANKQFATAQNQLNSMTGARGMGKLVTDKTRGYIPTNWRQTLDQMGSQGSELKGLVTQIRKNAGAIGSTNLGGAPSEVSAMADKSAEGDLAAAARANKLYDRANSRFTELQSLGDRIETAQDTKAIMDLMARLQVESNMLLNELVRIQAEQMSYARQKEIDITQRGRNESRQALNAFN